MKHTSKRLQALVLVLAMCVSFLQIPSFAAETHAGNYKVGKVTIDDNGKVTITEYCDNHSKGDACNTVTGEIETKKDKNGLIEASNVFKITSGKLKTDYEVSGSVTAQNVATCKDDSFVTYSVVVDQSYTNKVTLIKATGNHNFSDVPEVKTAADADKDTAHFKFLYSTATCSEAGESVYAKICKDCGQPITSATVSFPNANADQHKPKMVLNDKGEETTKVDITKEYVKATTCGQAGAYYAVTKCKYCGIDLKREYVSYEKATGLHNYEYTVTWNKTELNGKDDALTKQNVTIAGKCSVCGDTINVPATDIVGVDLVKEKTVEPTSNCQPGSKTYILTYKASTPVEKDLTKTTEVKTEVTVPYYPATHVAGTDGHVRTGIYVPDEESYVKATCTKDGHYNMVNPCKVCGDKEVVATVKIPATGKHTAAAAKKENVVAATTKKGGSYDLVVRCADCGEIISSTHKTTAKIVVNASKINSVKNYKGKKAKVTVKKTSSIIGYQIQYSTNKNFKSAKHVNTRKTSKYLTKLAKNKKYYVRVRTYKTVDGKLYFSSWSGAKTVTIKK